jgi:hypothetical protein
MQEDSRLGGISALNLQYMEKLDENFLALSGHSLYSGSIETAPQNYSAGSPSGTSLVRSCQPWK